MTGFESFQPSGWQREGLLVAAPSPRRQGKVVRRKQPWQALVAIPVLAFGVIGQTQLDLPRAATSARVRIVEESPSEEKVPRVESVGPEYWRRMQSLLAGLPAIEDDGDSGPEPLF